MDMGGHSHGGDMGAPPSMGGMRKSYTHMTFFWGKNSEILFQGWPGTRGGMYALALIFVFVMAVLVEWLSHCRLIKDKWPRLAAGFLQTVLHTLRVGLAYLLMLAVMSFNVGVLLVAIGGHALGFLLFSGALLGKSEKTGDLPPMKC
ncbi:copper transporter 1-like [Wolffia australiana]